MSFPLQDRQSFENLYERTHIAVFRYIYGLQGGPLEEVEDLTAETYLRAWKARRRFTGNEGAALGWLLRIARNLVIDSARRQKVRRSEVSISGYELELPAAGPSPEDEISLREQIGIARGLLAGLPVEQREMIVLRYILEWPVHRIAGHLGLLENTVSVTLRRAFQRLRDRWPPG
jgi:RNA polymerase sigma-70 factor (ECF subfamily)